LSARPASSELTTRRKSDIVINPDDALVQLQARQKVHRSFRVFPSEVFDEAEAAWSLLELVEAHHDTLDLSRFRKKLKHLLFRCVERKIPNIQSGRPLQYLLSLIGIAAVPPVLVQAYRFHNRIHVQGSHRARYRGCGCDPQACLIQQPHTAVLAR
jgi:hypothetical protein